MVEIWIRDYGDAVTTFATALIAVTALIAAYYSSVRYKKKVEEDTLDLMSKYETDPTLYDIHRNLSKIIGENKNDLSKITETKKLEFYLTMMFNYYEGIAYRFMKGTVKRDTVEEQLKEIIIRDVKLFVEGRKCGKIIPPAKPLFPNADKDFPRLMDIYKQFRPEEG